MTGKTIKYALLKSQIDGNVNSKSPFDCDSCWRVDFLGHMILFVGAFFSFCQSLPLDFAIERKVIFKIEYSLHVIVASRHIYNAIIHILILFVHAIFAP